MGNRKDSAHEDNLVKQLVERRNYQSPVVQKFGQLSRITQGSGGNGRDANNTMTKMSDRKLKQNIIWVGTLPMGLGLYLFDYLQSHLYSLDDGRQLGVMADEVERFMPLAVSLDASGYKAVDYKMLDIQPCDVASAFAG